VENGAARLRWNRLAISVPNGSQRKIGRKSMHGDWARSDRIIVEPSNLAVQRDAVLRESGSPLTVSASAACCQRFSFDQGRALRLWIGCMSAASPVKGENIEVAGRGLVIAVVCGELLARLARRVSHLLLRRSENIVVAGKWTERLICVNERRRGKGNGITRIPIEIPGSNVDNELPLAEGGRQDRRVANGLLVGSGH